MKEGALQEAIPSVEQALTREEHQEATLRVMKVVLEVMREEELQAATSDGVMQKGLQEAVQEMIEKALDTIQEVMQWVV